MSDQITDAQFKEAIEFLECMCVYAASEGREMSCNMHDDEPITKKNLPRCFACFGKRIMIGEEYDDP